MSETTKLSFIGLRVDKDMKRQLFEIKHKMEIEQGKILTLSYVIRQLIEGYGK